MHLAVVCFRCKLLQLSCTAAVYQHPVPSLLHQAFCFQPENKVYFCPEALESAGMCTYMRHTLQPGLQLQHCHYCWAAARYVDDTSLVLCCGLQLGCLLLFPLQRATLSRSAAWVQSRSKKARS